MSNTRLKLAKNQAKAKQHLEAELLLIENYSLLCMLSFKTNRTHPKKCPKKLRVSILMRLHDHL